MAMSLRPVITLAALCGAATGIDLESPRLGHEASMLTAELLEELGTRNGIAVAAPAAAAAAPAGGLMRRDRAPPSSLVSVASITADGEVSAAPQVAANLAPHGRHVAATTASPEPKEFDMVIDCVGCGECAWGGADTAGNSTGKLEGNGHSEEDCKTACLSSPTCHWAALSSSGYCHMFEVCNDPTPEGDKKRWTKQPKWANQEQVMVLDCDGCGECPWSAADHKGQASLGGNNHTAEDCRKGCLASPSCQFAARSPTGYCHMFTSCSQSAPDGDKTRWRKQAAPMHGKAAGMPKLAPDTDPWANGVGIGVAGRNGPVLPRSVKDKASLELSAKAQAQFTMDEMEKVSRRAGVVSAQSTEESPSATPGDSDIDTKEELLALYGFAAIIVLLISGCVYRRLYWEDQPAEKMPLESMRVDGLTTK